MLKVHHGQIRKTDESGWRFPKGTTQTGKRQHVLTKPFALTCSLKAPRAELARRQLKARR